MRKYKTIIFTIDILLVAFILFFALLTWLNKDSNTMPGSGLISASPGFLDDSKLPSKSSNPSANPGEEVVDGSPLPGQTNLPIPNDDKEVTMLFTGDVLLSTSTLGAYQRGGLNGMVAKEVVNYLTEADITMVNQEFPFSNRGSKMEKKQYTFRADPKHVSLLTELGIDIVSLANNHTLDFGREALSDTFVALDNAKVKYVGAGENINRAKQIEYITIGQTKVAFIAASRVIPVTDWNATTNKSGLLTTYDPTIALEQIKEASANSDYVVIYVHWGVEHTKEPVAYQKNMAKQYIDAGADVVVGSHPHILQGIEYYQNKPIIYSLGNFVFGKSIEETAMAKVVIGEDKQINVSLIPCYATEGQTRLITEEQSLQKFRQNMQNISYGVKITEENEVVKVVE